MLSTPSISEIDTQNPTAFAFVVRGEVSSEDMEAMATRMNSAFDLHDRVNMILIFRGYEGSETGSALNAETMKAQFRALSNVEKYVVVGAPDSAETIIEAFGAILPVEAETYDLDDLAQAWTSIGASAPLPVAA